MHFRQGGAADVVNTAMIKLFLNKELQQMGWKMVLQVISAGAYRKRWQEKDQLYYIVECSGPRRNYSRRARGNFFSCNGDCKKYYGIPIWRQEPLES